MINKLTKSIYKMKNIKSKIINILCVVSLAFLSACNDKKDNGAPDDFDESFRAVSVTPISGVRIAWDYGSIQQLANRGATPRMVRVSEQELVAVYEWNGNVYLIKSVNNGVTWSAPVTLFARGTHTGTNGTASIAISDLMAQPALTLLPDGTLAAACAVRYQYTLTNVVYEYAAALKFRRINSATLALEPEMEVYANYGVEHPAFLQLPDGALQLYFTNGAIAQPIRILNSTSLDLMAFNEQNVSVIESNDGGVTWSSAIKDYGPDGIDRGWAGARVVASRAHRKNICPAPAIVGENIVVGLADNKTLNYKPYTVRSPLSENWKFPVADDTPDRRYALYEILPDKYFMSAPALLVLPGGATLLSYETDEGRIAGFETMELAIGDNDAYFFKHRNRPFPFADDEKAVGNSLMLFDEHTVVALTGSNRYFIDAPDETAPWLIKGYLLNDLTIGGGEITDFPIFVSATTGANLNAGLSIDGANLYVSVNVADKTSIPAESGATNGDGVYLYIDAANLSLLKVDEGTSKFWISSNGEVMRWNGKEGGWENAASDDITVYARTITDGYAHLIVIPRASLTNFNAQGIRFAIALTDYTDQNTGVTEMLTLCQELRSSSWMEVRFEN